MPRERAGLEPERRQGNGHSRPPTPRGTRSGDRPSPDVHGARPGWTTPPPAPSPAAGGRRGSWCGPAGRKSGAPELSHSTITGNVGVAIRSRAGSSLAIRGSIVWNNAAESIVTEDGGSVAASHSCIQAGAPWPGEGNIDEAPLFVDAGQWDDNGTPGDPLDDFWFEGDYRLRDDSPCVDAGSCAGAPAFDLDGLARPAGPECDMGAFERDGDPAVRFIRGEVNADGRMDLGDMIFTLTYLFAQGDEPPCLKSADVNDDGALEIGDPIFGLNYLFASGPAPPTPVAGCGFDFTADTLECEEFPPCGASR
jgi:hypothetical protein